MPWGGGNCCLDDLVGSVGPAWEKSTNLTHGGECISSEKPSSHSRRRHCFWPGGRLPARLWVDGKCVRYPQMGASQKECRSGNWGRAPEGARYLRRNTNQDVLATSPCRAPTATQQTPPPPAPHEREQCEGDAGTGDDHCRHRRADGRQGGGGGEQSHPGVRQMAGRSFSRLC